MTSVEIISLIVTAIGVTSFAAIFTILYRNYTLSELSEINAGKRDIEILDEFIDNAQESSVKRKKIINIIKTVVFYAVLMLLVPLLTFSFFNKINGDFTMIGGKGFMVVASGSMSEKHEDNDYLIQNSLDNQFDTYDIIILNKVSSPSTLKKYDVIAFVNDKGINIIHRIVDFEYTATGVRYVTRGDSNNANDAYRPSFEDVIGVYADQRIPVVGIFIMFFQSYGGMVTVAALIYCLFMLRRYNTKAFNTMQARVDLLQNAIDVHSIIDLKEVKTEFVEKIYYKGCAYFFTEKGFMKKEELSPEKSTEKTLVRVVETENQTLSEEIVIPAVPVDENKEN